MAGSARSAHLFIFVINFESDSRTRSKYDIKILYKPYEDKDILLEYVSQALFKLSLPLTVFFSIVFVHGLTGDRENTWTSGETLWPQQLLPIRLPEARVMTFGFDADVVKFFSVASQNRIDHHAQNLISSLADIRDETETVVVTVYSFCTSSTNKWSHRAIFRSCL
jgi:hypothetical protein